MRDFINRNVAFLFLFPAMGAIFLFFFIPVVASLFMSFTDFDIYSLGDISKVRFVGFKNYIELFKHPLFWKALGNTAYFVFIGGPLSIFVSLMAALLINSKMLKFKSFFRLAYFLPVVTTLVAIAIVWRYVYHPEFGLMNYFLRIFGIKPVDWLGDPRFAMPAIILMAVWKNFGYNMIIFTAGLQNIPGELYEASWIDGANKWKQFIHVTLPLLSPTTLFVSITTMIGYFQLFAEPYVMTQGGPLNSTLSIVLLMYNEGFKWWKMGYSASIAFTLFFIVLIITLIQLKLQKGIKID
mgnify:CR=1 FL=1